MLAPPAVRPSAPADLSISSISPLSKRPSPLSRRSTLKRSIDDADSMSIPSSPSKRSRVTFDSDVETFSFHDDDLLDPLVVKEEIHRALQRHLIGDESSYDKLKTKFTTPYNQEDAPSTKTLRVHLQGILSHISILNKNCYDLVHAIIASEWVGRDQAYFSLFAKVLGNLSAAQGGFVGKITHMLVELLGPQKTRRIPGHRPVRQALIHQRVFQILQYITQLAPTASGAVIEAVRKRMSWEFSKASDRLTYIRSFIELIEYLPELTSDILTTIMIELVKLDVSVQTDLDEDEDDAEDDILQYISSSQTLVGREEIQRDADSTVDSDDDSSSVESEPEEDPLANPIQLQRAKLKDDIKQIDQIMDKLFEYYTKALSSASFQSRDGAMLQLQAQFHNIILPTYRSRHPQFLIFHFAQSSPILVDQFVSSCIQVLVDKHQPHILRQSAAAYFSGFVGRGAHVSPTVVSDCVGLLCDQLNILRKAYEPGCRGPDLKRYSDFYATMQAILYIFCFRWRDLASISSDMDDDSDQEDDEPEAYHFSDSLRSTLSSAIYSPLNPLRICTPDIVEQFAKLTFALQFLYLHSKIETNKHVRLHSHWRSLSDLHISQPERDLSWVGDNGMLEGYFPYDPYHLPVSKRWLEGDYVQWKGIPGDQIEDTDSENGDDMELQAHSVDDDTGTE